MSAHDSEQVPGQFTLVLHTHLPWLAHHGRWPVGEEWLYQAWAGSYPPPLPVLEGLAAGGARGGGAPRRGHARPHPDPRRPARRPVLARRPDRVARRLAAARRAPRAA